jgi:hypothetical protein
VQGRELGWPLWTYLSMAGSITALALFVVRRLDQRVIWPPIDPPNQVLTVFAAHE